MMEREEERYPDERLKDRIRGNKAHVLDKDKEHLKKVFRGVRNLKGLCLYFNIPQTKTDVDYATECFLASNVQRKVRKMIWQLDVYGETAQADSLMEFSEIPADQSFQAIAGDWDEIYPDYTIVPRARAQLFRDKFHDHNSLAAEAGIYYACCHPEPNWKTLSLHLYKAGETQAVEMAKHHIQSVADPSLTRENILEVVSNVPLWTSSDSSEHLEMPCRQHDAIVEDLRSEQAKDQIVSTWLSGHPCPSWEHIRNLLQWMERLGRASKGEANKVEEKYIKMTPRKAKEILEASLEHSSLPLGYLKVMAVGVARAGKTLTKKHIFHMECDPNSSFSTGACEEPVMALRSVNWETIQVNLPSLKGFDPLEQDDINRIVARKLHEGSHQGKVAKVVEDIVMSSVSSTLSDASESLPTSSLRSIPEDVFDLQTSVTENLSTHEVAAKSNGSSSSGSGISKAETAPNTASFSSEGESRATQAVVNALITASSERAKLEAEASKRYRSLHVEDQLYGLQVILYFDSGGQPQFHEIVAAFSHNICLVLIFVKLNESLDALCNNALTDAEGESFKEQCPSLLTNKEMVAQFVHTMMCKPISGSADFQTRFMVIGTHKDLMHECKNESLAQKNEKLAELLLPALKEVLIMNGDDVIFAVNVNSKELGEEDSVCFDLIHQEISDLKAAVQVNTPVSFLMLFTDVKKYGEQEGKRVLSVQECQDIAGGLKMDRPTLEAAHQQYEHVDVYTIHSPWHCVY